MISYSGVGIFWTGDFFWGGGAELDSEVAHNETIDIGLKHINNLISGIDSSIYSLDLTWL